ncbi:MAG: tetratricopeptide repeat protein, partial [Nevskia sp.]|nr:tetratricopeptide repeat protein [Nevskia sp.]
MTDHYDEEAQVEELRKWLRENWLPLASGLALGLLAIFGWQAWDARQDAHAGAASHVFEDLGQAMNAQKADDAKAMADRLVKDFSDTPYAAAAQLKVAAIEVIGKQLDDAAARLRWVVDYEQSPSALARVGTLLRLRSRGYDPA